MIISMDDVRTLESLTCRYHIWKRIDKPEKYYQEQLKLLYYEAALFFIDASLVDVDPSDLTATREEDLDGKTTIRFYWRVPENAPWLVDGFCYHVPEGQMQVLASVKKPAYAVLSEPQARVRPPTSETRVVTRIGYDTEAKCWLTDY